MKLVREWCSLPSLGLISSDILTFPCPANSTVSHCSRDHWGMVNKPAPPCLGSLSTLLYLSYKLMYPRSWLASLACQTQSFRVGMAYPLAIKQREFHPRISYTAKPIFANGCRVRRRSPLLPLWTRRAAASGLFWEEAMRPRCAGCFRVAFVIATWFIVSFLSVPFVLIYNLLYDIHDQLSMIYIIYW